MVRITLFILGVLFIAAQTFAQDILPPVLPWKGKSLELIAKKDNVWITPAEVSNFETTPTYDETVAFLQKMVDATDVLRMISIGKSANHRDIKAIIVSNDKAFEKSALVNSSKPLLLIQAGIHAGEIDGKDAGLMLVRDIVFGKKRELLKEVNIMFVPILNVDGHERISAYNRVNQRGPANMGWRTNARNLNLNRDYTKLDTEEIQAIISVMNEYDPELYLDLHVTDGADYQYDITYGFSDAFSPSGASWLKNKLSPIADKQLKDYGHIPGPLVFTVNENDLSSGIIDYAYSSRFSNGYGDIRHLPTILVENHSLKPYKQRVLGTYVFLQSVIQAVSSERESLKAAIASDRNVRTKDVALTWKRSSKTDSMLFQGIASQKQKSEITNTEYVQWLGKPFSQKVPHIKLNAPDLVIKRPKAFWIPATHKEVIERIKMHGVQYQVVNEPKEVTVKMFRLSDYKFSTTPFEGHFTVTGKTVLEDHKEIFYPGSIRVETDQPLGDLVIHLLHPDSPDSFLQWGFFPEIFTRTEYIEQYAIEPLARKMLASDAKLKNEFEEKKKSDSAFANSPQEIYQWFYKRSPYFDNRWLLYPIGMEE